MSDCPQLGGRELDPEALKTAKALHDRMTAAGKTRQHLDVAVRAVQKPGGELEARALEALLAEAENWEDLLRGDWQKGREALEAWRCQVVSEEKLNRVLREGKSTARLAQAIQEAAATGVHVQVLAKIACHRCSKCFCDA